VLAPLHADPQIADDPQSPNARVRHEPRDVQRPTLGPFLAAAALAAALAATASAQHATGLDIEDGSRVFASVCANCHGPDGNLIAGIDLGRGQFRRPYTDNELASVIANGIPNTAMPPSPSLGEEQIERVVAYLRSNAEPRPAAVREGDAARGKALFEGKGECTECHRVGSTGSRTGPDLTQIARVRRAAELEASLLDPGAEVQANNRFYRVVTASGEEVTGRLLNHDTYTVQMLDWDERLRSFRKAELRELGFDATPMPSYAKKLNAQQIADLVAYLVSLRGPSNP
jgi:putative heme-binding domain-containing protein